MTALGFSRIVSRCLVNQAMQGRSSYEGAPADFSHIYLAVRSELIKVRPAKRNDIARFLNGIGNFWVVAHLLLLFMYGYVRAISNYIGGRVNSLSLNVFPTLIDVSRQEYLNLPALLSQSSNPNAAKIIFGASA